LLRLRVARDANKALSKIKTIPGIQHARLDEEHPGLNAIEIGLDSTASENTAELIAQAVISDGCGLRELASKTKSLEEVFFQATR
jgi:hypothetical protein